MVVVERSCCCETGRQPGHNPCLGSPQAPVAQSNARYTSVGFQPHLAALLAGSFANSFPAARSAREGCGPAPTSSPSTVRKLRCTWVAQEKRIAPQTLQCAPQPCPRHYVVPRALRAVAVRTRASQCRAGGGFTIGASLSDRRQWRLPPYRRVQTGNEHIRRRRKTIRIFGETRSRRLRPRCREQSA